MEDLIGLTYQTNTPSLLGVSLNAFVNELMNTLEGIFCCKHFVKSLVNKLNGKMIGSFCFVVICEVNACDKIFLEFLSRFLNRFSRL